MQVKFKQKSTSDKELKKSHLSAAVVSLRVIDEVIRETQQLLSEEYSSEDVNTISIRLNDLWMENLRNSNMLPLPKEELHLDDVKHPLLTQPFPYEDNINGYVGRPEPFMIRPVLPFSKPTNKYGIKEKYVIRNINNEEHEESDTSDEPIIRKTKRKSLIIENADQVEIEIENEINEFIELNTSENQNYDFTNELIGFEDVDMNDLDNLDDMLNIDVDLLALSYSDEMETQQETQLQNESKTKRIKLGEFEFNDSDSDEDELATYYERIKRTGIKFKFCEPSNNDKSIG